MAREWIALERHEGRAHDLSLYARALHAQLHRWVDGEGRIDARLEGDLCESMARSIAFRFGATRGDRRLIAGHLAELVSVGAVVLSSDGLELRALADGADLVRHKLAVGDRPQPTKRLRVSSTTSNDGATIGHEASRTSNEASRTETKDDASARNDATHLPRVEENRREESRELTSFVLPAREARSAQPEETKARTSKAKPTQLVADVAPSEGTAARKVYDAIVSDPVLSSLVRPGDFAARVCAEGAYPGVDVLAQVRRAGAWAAGQKRAPWRDVRAGLLTWLRRAAEDAQQSPQPHRPAPPPVRPVPTPAQPLPAANTANRSIIAETRVRIAAVRAGIDPDEAVRTQLPRAAGGES